MKHRLGICRNALMLAVGGVLGLHVWAQSANTEVPDQSCRDTVVKFEESMAFVRKSVGYGKAAEIKESLLPNKLESELFAKEGYCGIARHLRAKKLLGKL